MAQKLQRSSESFIDGIMCGEGLLRDPAIFLAKCGSEMHEVCYDKDRYELFTEYCQLSNAYYLQGGWEGLDDYNHRNKKYRRGQDSQESAVVFARKEDQESMQVCIARQHLTWMLGKSGHGRSVRYRYINTNVYRRHTDLMKALNEAKSLTELQRIAEINFPKGLKSSDEYDNDRVIIANSNSYSSNSSGT